VICCLNDEVFKHLKRLSTEADRSTGVDSHGILDSDSPEESAMSVGDVVKVIDPEYLDPSESLIAVGRIVSIESDDSGTYYFIGDEEYVGRFHADDYSFQKI
jgi:hypothetical protein